MKSCMLIVFSALLLIACRQGATGTTAESPDISGTWQLVTSKIISGSDTVVTFPVKNQEMIKLFNGTHFAFFRHDLGKGAGEGAVFEAGGGTYTLSGNRYSEHLSYCSAREWENRDFSFNLALRSDTLIQQGIEKIDSLGVNREIIEIYTRKR